VVIEFQTISPVRSGPNGHHNAMGGGILFVGGNMSQKEFNINDFNERCAKIVDFFEAMERIHQKAQKLTKAEEFEETALRS
jgi:hypothetical protein